MTPFWQTESNRSVWLVAPEETQKGFLHFLLWKNLPSHKNWLLWQAHAIREPKKYKEKNERGGRGGRKIGKGGEGQGRESGPPKYRESWEEMAPEQVQNFKLTHAETRKSCYTISQQFQMETVWKLCFMLPWQCINYMLKSKW